MLKVAFSSLFLFASVQTGTCLLCYTCSFTYSALDNVTMGDPACADATWGLNASAEGSISFDCLSCYKEFTDLGADRFEVIRGCASGLLPPTPGLSEDDKTQASNTCATTALKSGQYSRCACNTDLCNARDECDVAHACFAPCVDVCPTCPPNSSPAPAATAMATTAAVLLVAATRLL